MIINTDNVVYRKISKSLITICNGLCHFNCRVKMVGEQFEGRSVKRRHHPRLEAWIKIRTSEIPGMNYCTIICHVLI